MVALDVVISLVSIVLVVVSWVARIIAEVLFVFVLLVIRVIILTFVIWISNVCFIYFYFILTCVTSMWLISWTFLSLMLCLVMMRGSIFAAFSNAVCRFSGRSWLNLPVISSPSLPYGDDAWWMQCILLSGLSISSSG